MGMSNDSFAEIQKVKELSDFINFIKNPDKYDSIVKAAADVLKDATKVIQAYSDIENANIYLTNAKDFYEKKKIEIDETEQKLQLKFREKEKDLLSQADLLEVAKQKLEANQTEVANKKKELEANSAKIADMISIYSGRLDAIANKENELSQREQDLNDKAEKLKSLLT